MTRKPDVDRHALAALVRRAFGTSVPVRCERTPDGVSTQVYRLSRGTEVFYLRVAERADENLETDVELHRRLRAQGVRVAGIVHIEPFDSAIGRSVMITTEIPGAPLTVSTAPDIAHAVIEEAAADLAVINQQPVDGFGWVRRSGSGWPLRAEHPSYPPFLTEGLPKPWPGALAALFPRRDLDTIADLVDQEEQRPPAEARLAHGDFDTTHIFCVDGRYTGVIDFGEIRGADPLFDLGHFELHDSTASLPALLRGYQRVRALPAGYPDAIRRSAILLGLRQLCRWLDMPDREGLITQRSRRISQLIGVGCGPAELDRLRSTM